MSYELSFASEFFWGPYDEHILSHSHLNGVILMPDEDGNYIEQHPETVYQALTAMSDEDWSAACNSLGKNPEYTDVHEMITQVREVNTCSNITTPVEVWLDEEGYHTVLVH